MPHIMKQESTPHRSCLTMTEALCSKCGQRKEAQVVSGRARSVCRPCTRAASRAWRNANPQAAKAAQKKYRATQRERVLEQDRARYHRLKTPESQQKARERATLWRERNREKHRRTSRAWAVANPGRVAENHASWRETNREYVNATQSARKKLHPEKRREETMRRRARELGAAVGKVDYLEIVRRDKDVCHLCGKHVEEKDRHFDHVIPLSKGGAHSTENIRVAHGRCNVRKGSRILPSVA